MAAKTAQQPAPRWEILVRNRLGHETVHRHRGGTAEDAVDAMLGATGLDREQVVEVNRVDP